MASLFASDTPPETAPATDRRMGVLLPLPLIGAYDYLVPRGMDLAAGDFVEVPLGSRSVLGVVWGEAKDDVPRNKLKQIEAKIEMAPLPEISRRFIDWVATYCLSAPGAVLKMAMSVSDAFKPERSLKAYAIGDPESGHVTAARQRVLNALSDVPSMLPGELARAAGVTSGVLAKMAELGQLRVVAQPLPKPFGQPDPDLSGHARRLTFQALGRSAWRDSSKAFDMGTVPFACPSGEDRPSSALHWVSPPCQRPELPHDDAQVSSDGSRLWLDPRRLGEALAHP